MNSFTGRRVFAVAATLFVAFLLLLPPYRDAFLLDDYKHLEFIAPVADVPWLAYRIASPFWIGWYYRPWQHWLILANYMLFGYTPLPYYVTLAGLHLLGIGLLYRVARRGGRAVLGAALAALLFAVHGTYNDTLGWISSLSIVSAAVFGLLAVLSLQRALAGKRRGGLWLAATLAALLFALWSREESAALLLVLVATWWLHTADRRRPSPGVVIAALVALALAGGYGVFQLVRPTWTIGLPGEPLPWLSPATWGGFATHLLERYFFLRLAELPGQPAAGAALALAALAVGFWAWRNGDRVTRLGLAWAASYLFVVYGAIWARDPALFADRYLYLPWLGLSLALGQPLAHALAVASRPPARRAAAVGLLVAFAAGNVYTLRQAQATRRAEVDAVDVIRTRMRALLPSIGPATHIFANRLPPEPDYAQAMAAAWYGRPLPWPGGDMSRLRGFQPATADTYVFDYDGRRLHNLMPELQLHRETTFLWTQSPRAEWVAPDGATAPLDEGAYQLEHAAGPPRAPRWALRLDAPAEGRAALVYEAAIPPNSRLAYGYWKAFGGLDGEDGMGFHVTIVGPTGEIIDSTSSFVTPRDGESWTQVERTLNHLAGQTVQIRFEVSAGQNALHDHGYWANPRIVVD